MKLIFMKHLLYRTEESMEFETWTNFMVYLKPSYTRQLVASNICGYFDLVSNMLPRIESCSISSNMLLGC